MKKIINNDNLKELKNKEECSVDLILTDIPYGMDKINALDLIKNNSNNKKGFMGKTWDCLPTVEILTEFNRVLKYGGWFITTFIPRQDLQAVLYCRLLEAGFDISFSPIYHTFSSGFPKGQNISSKLDKRLKFEREKVISYDVRNTFEKLGQTQKWAEKAKELGYHLKDSKESLSDQGKYCDGLYGGFQPKPAVEIIIVAQKKYNAKSQVNHILEYCNERFDLLEKGIKEEDLSLYTKLASGGTYIDNSKIPLEKGDVMDIGGRANCSRGDGYGFKALGKDAVIDNKGRYPANILVSDNALDVGRETKSVKMESNIRTGNASWIGGEKKSGTTHDDKGDLSRFFSKDAWVRKHLPEFYKLSIKTLQLEEDAEKIYPFLNVSKASVEEKNLGTENLERKRNDHITAKNISLFSYLLCLFSKENDIVLDPYCGSGATLIACELMNRNYIGIELLKEHYDIATARVEYWQKVKNKWEIEKANRLL